MSEQRPNCKICLHVSSIEINKLVREGTKPGKIAATFGRRKKAAIASGHSERGPQTFSVNTLKAHMVDCLGMIAVDSDRISYVQPDDPRLADIAPPEQMRRPAEPPPNIDPADLLDPVKRRMFIAQGLAAKLSELSGKELLALHMAEIRLATAEAERDARKVAPAAAKSGSDDDEDEVGMAIAQAAGHQPKLRGLRGGKSRAG